MWIIIDHFMVFGIPSLAFTIRKLKTPLKTKSIKVLRLQTLHKIIKTYVICIYLHIYSPVKVYARRWGVLGFQTPSRNVSTLFIFSTPLILKLSGN